MLKGEGEARKLMYTLSMMRNRENVGRPAVRKYEKKLGEACREVAAAAEELEELG